MGHIWISYVFDMGHYPPYQTHMMPCSGSLLSYLWESYVFRKVPYNSQIWEWYGLWEWYGMIAMQRNDMGMVWEVQSVPHLWKSYVFRKVPYHSHTWECYGLWEWYGMIAMRGNGMGAYISPIPNPHLWERYIRYSYWGKLRYGVTAPYLSQNYSRKWPLCD